MHTHDEVIQANKKVILDALRAAGIALVSCSYSGDGDSGQLDEHAECFDPSGKSVDCPATPIRVIETHYRWNPDTKTSDESSTEVDKPLLQAMEDFFWGILGDLHGGWENNAGGQGEFIVDVAQGTISLRHAQRYEEFDISKHVI